MFKQWMLVALLVFAGIVACTMEEELGFIAGGYCEMEGVETCDDEGLTILRCTSDGIDLMWQPVTDCPEGCTMENGYAECIGGMPDNAADKDTQLPDMPDTTGGADDATVDTAVTDTTVTDDPTTDDPVTDDPATDDPATDDPVTDEPVDADTVDTPVDNDTSVPVDECTTQTNPCNDNGDTAATCTDTVDGYTCACSSGFGESAGSCADLDECTLNTDNCDTNATCANTAGSFTCDCNDYYDGNGTACAFCAADGQCGATCAACSGDTLHCKDNGDGTSQCAACTLEEHCSGGTPHCLLADGLCVQCRDANDCNTGAGETCFALTHTCGVNFCGDGTPLEGEECDDGNDLNSDDCKNDCTLNVCGDTELKTSGATALLETFEGGALPSYASGSTNPWLVDTTYPYQGTYGIHSKTIGNSATSEITLTNVTDGKICFYLRGSSEDGYDYLKIYVDGTEKLSVTGFDYEGGWKQVCFTGLTPGSRALKFAFSKDYDDSYGDPGLNGYAVDNILFSGALEECLAGQTVSCSTFGWDLGTATCSDCRWNTSACEADSGGC